MRTRADGYVVGRLTSEPATVDVMGPESRVRTVSEATTEPVEINGDGETTRDFCFVANAVQANLLAALTDDPKALNRVYNIAVGERISLNWLSEYVPGLPAAEEVARRLTAGGLEVEAVERTGQGLEGVVAARILASEKHPNGE